MVARRKWRRKQWIVPFSSLASSVSVELTTQIPSVIVRLLRHTSDNNCALCDKSVKLATFEGIQMLNNSGYGGIAESTCIRNTRVLKKMLSQHFCSNKLF